MEISFRLTCTHSNLRLFYHSSQFGETYDDFSLSQSADTAETHNHLSSAEQREMNLSIF